MCCPRWGTILLRAFRILSLGVQRSPPLLLGVNSMLVSIVGMALYTGYVFMPQHIMAILHYFEIVQ
ncbi:PREDICTED: serine palmitoyltransferase small subunit A [Fulmarus glacialis]|uniref:serine palmitoyltransferase small subunit A n=1 Tax=Fulmarus glacialis TaxID=30455 RepID=UPI00051C17F4|nr:PREDICTED: serine palmitoyltransferase small subunit A [Fulmarus glacialis]